MDTRSTSAQVHCTKCDALVQCTVCNALVQCTKRNALNAMHKCVQCTKYNALCTMHCNALQKGTVKYYNVLTTLAAKGNTMCKLI